MPYPGSDIAKGLKCTIKNGVVKLAKSHCRLCNYPKRHPTNRGRSGLVHGGTNGTHAHICMYCGLNVDEYEKNIIHFIWTEDPDNYFAHSKCYDGKKGSGKNDSYLHIINYEESK